MKIKTLLIASLAIVSVSVMAQTKKSFTLNDLLSGGDTFWNLRPKTIHTTWWGERLMQQDIDCVSEVERNGRTLKYFTLDDINRWAGATEQNRVRTLSNATFPYPDQPLVLVNTGREAILVNWTTGSAVWRQARIGGESHSDWNAASRAKAYVKDHNLYVQTADGRSLPVSTDGSRELVYGQSVHRDEFGIHKGTFWSPKGTLLAFYRMDQSMVTDYPQVDIAERPAAYRPDKYPMAGMTSHKVTVGVFDPATGKSIYLQAGDPTDRYFTNVSWSPDERTLYLIELNRDQDIAQLVSYDARTGRRIQVLYEEHHPKYVHPTHGLTFLPWDNEKFIYQSEKDGYNHLYLFDTTGKELRQLTEGKFVVLELLGFNTKKKSLIIRSTECSPIQNNLFSVDLKTGRRTLLDCGEGVHSGSLSPAGTYVVDRYSSPTVAGSVNRIATATARCENLLTAEDPWKDYNVPEITCGTLKAADNTTDLYYRMVKPVGFDPSKKYPTVVYVYGGPGLRNVEASRNYAARGWEIYMAQRGYLLFILDNRGSKDRGLEFENVTFRHLGVEEMKDQMRGVDYLKSLPYVDASRMGVHGWSFGGFMTTNLMCTYPDVFKVGVAGGPVIDWSYYEVMYGERYMDTPQANPEGYKGSNLRLKAGNLKGRLQVIIGYNDPVCVPQHALSFLRACEDAGTQPDFFAYPGQGHNMSGRDMIHLHERITRYFDDYLK